MIERLEEVQHPSPPLLEALKKLVIATHECHRTIGAQSLIVSAKERVLEELQKEEVNQAPPIDVKRIMNHSGAIGLLCELSVHIGSGWEADEYRDSIEQCLTDYCEITGGTFKRILHRFEYTPGLLTEGADDGDQEGNEG